MLIVILLVLSYVSFIFIAETFSVFPPGRFNPAKGNHRITRRRYLGYWSAFSITLGGTVSVVILMGNDPAVLFGGLDSTVMLTNKTLKKLPLMIVIVYSVLMLPAVIFYWLVGAKSELKGIENHGYYPSQYKKMNARRAQKIHVDYEL